LFEPLIYRLFIRLLNYQKCLKIKWWDKWDTRRTLLYSYMIQNQREVYELYKILNEILLQGSENTISTS